MDLTCKQNQCYDCSLDNEACFCNKCSCAQVHVCINCVGRYADNNMYKKVKVYCTKCEKIVSYWYQIER